MRNKPDEPADHRRISKPLERTLPNFHGPRNARIGRQPAIHFRLRRVVQHVHYARPAHSRRVVHTRVREIVICAQLLRALLSPGSNMSSLLLKMQAARRARLDARRLQPFAHTVRAQRALKTRVRLRIHLRNIERAPSNAVAAADAVRLLKIHDPIGVLYDRAIRWTTPPDTPDRRSACTDSSASATSTNRLPARAR